MHIYINLLASLLWIIFKIVIGKVALEETQREAACHTAPTPFTLNECLQVGRVSTFHGQLFLQNVSADKIGGLQIEIEI